MTSLFPKYLGLHVSLCKAQGDMKRHWPLTYSVMVAELRGDSPGAGHGPCKEGVSIGLSELESALIQLKSFYKHREAFTESRD